MLIDEQDILFISNFLLIQRYILRGNTTKDIFARISKIAKLGESKIWTLAKDDDHKW